MLRTEKWLTVIWIFTPLLAKVSIFRSQVRNSEYVSLLTSAATRLRLDAVVRVCVLVLAANYSRIHYAGLASCELAGVSIDGLVPWAFNRGIRSIVTMNNPMTVRLIR